jgi:hypothetical protein
MPGVSVAETGSTVGKVFGVIEEFRYVSVQVFVSMGDGLAREVVGKVLAVERCHDSAGGDLIAFAGGIGADDLEEAERQFSKDVFGDVPALADGTLEEPGIGGLVFHHASVALRPVSFSQRATITSQ